MMHAVFFVDLQQNQIDPKWGIPDAPAFMTKMTHALAEARSHGDLVVHIQHDGPADEPDAPFTFMWELILTPNPEEKVFRKTVFSAFAENPDLLTHLHDHAVTDVTIIGVQSEYCIQANARAARDAGFTVHVPAGMHSTLNGDIPAAQMTAQIHAELIAEGISERPFRS
jgi:nicotinamidase-related amidase